jgi:hypothetical protein
MPANGSAERRAYCLHQLEDERVDLLVIGAGIIGSRVAYEAAYRGLRVVLVDAGDFGGGTSAASSKLLHGGLRYLASGDFRLVRELQTERNALTTRIAPHLVRPLPLLLVVERGQARQVPRLAYRVLAIPAHGCSGRVGRPSSCLSIKRRSTLAASSERHVRMTRVSRSPPCMRPRGQAPSHSTMSVQSHSSERTDELRRPSSRTYSQARGELFIAEPWSVRPVRGSIPFVASRIHVRGHRLG